MPPRRVALGTTTPRAARSSAGRPSARANTPGRTTALESTPLPDVEAEQSFAYGSSNTKPLPQQLVARRKMTIEQMAETLDAGIIQAERNFQVQREQAEQYGRSLTDARAARAARRSSERESRDSLETSVASAPSPVPKQTRSNKSLSSAQTENWLHDIQEEPGSDEEGVAQEEAGPGEEDRSQIDSSLSSNSHDSLSCHTPTPKPSESSNPVEGSSMPDINLFDQTYTRERDIAQGAGFDPGYRAFRGHGVFYAYRGEHLATGLFHRSVRFISETWLMVLEASQRFWLWVCDWAFFDIWRTLQMSMVMLALGIGIFALLVAGFWMICESYCETPWSIEPSRPWHHTMNSVCRYSISNRFDKGNSTLTYTRASTEYVNNLATRIKHQEQFVRDLTAKYETATATIKELTENQEKLLNLQADLQTQLASAKAAQATVAPKSNKLPWLQSALMPIFRRINYASPGHGAAIDPYLTSPTKEKKFHFYQRLILGTTGMKKYQSRPPIEALKSWSEVGDCWCAAAAVKQPNHQMDGQEGRYIQLSVVLEYDIFPDEVVIEHLPLKTTVNPGSAPKDIEVWADFSHLTQAEFASLMIGPHPLNVINWYPQLAMIGKLRYDAVANEQEGKYVQIFRLDFNQDGRDEMWTKKILFRVGSNWGAENTCIYRVRVHGVPVRAHGKIVREDD